MKALSQLRENLDIDKIEELIDEAYVTVFSTDAGRILLEHLMEEGHVLEALYEVGDTTENVFIREGRRSMVLQVMARARWAEQEFIRATMEVENAGGN